MKPVAITAFTATSTLGRGNAAMLDALRRGKGGLKANDFDRAELRAWIGRVAGLEDEPITGALAEYDCRNNRLAQIGLAQDGFREAVLNAKDRYGAKRVAVLLGTSTSGILQTELAYRRRDAQGDLPDVRYRHAQNLYSMTDFVRRALALEGPSMTISTACSSSAKVFASAARYLEAGIADAAVVGGVDSLCLTTMHGFTSLQLVSDEPCRPFDAARKGMSIGEAAGYALLEKIEPHKIALLGYGESSDAYHMSTPQPEGEGALGAMRQALSRAGVEPGDIDYVNAHGTATPANDRAEDRALVRLFGKRVPVSSTKGFTGHTLGAAGIVEAIVCFLALEHGFIPATLNSSALEPGLESMILLQNRPARVKRALSNSFGFGGSNCSLVFGGIGLLAPGLEGWPAGARVLSGEAAFAPAAVQRPVATLLPPAERRRCAPSVAWALAVAQEAVAQSGLDAGDVRHGVRFERWRRRHRPSPVHRAGDAGRRGVAHRLPQFRAQRRHRLLEHRRAFAARRPPRSARTTARSPPVCSRPPVRSLSRPVQCCSSWSTCPTRHRSRPTGRCGTGLRQRSPSRREQRWRFPWTMARPTRCHWAIFEATRPLPACRYWRRSPALAKRWSGSPYTSARCRC